MGTKKNLVVEAENQIRSGFTAPVIEKSSSLPGAINAAISAVSDHVLRSDSVREFVELLPKGEGTSCPDSPIGEIVRYMAQQIGHINKSDPIVNLNFNINLVRPVFMLEREQVLAATGQIDDITPVERLLLETGSRIASFVDLLWADWFKKVVVPYQSLPEYERKAYEKRLESQLDQYDYTVFNRQTWAKAFSQQGTITAITDLLKGLCESEVIRETPGLSEYFNCLILAYECTDIAQVEKYWAGVDWAWIELPRELRIIPVHGMENGYEHPFCISPEFRLEVRTENQEVRTLVDSIRAGTISYSKELGLGDEFIDVVTSKLGLLDIDEFVCAVRSGVSLNFRISGQVVPNRQEVMNIGGKIFLNPTTGPILVERYNHFAKLHCLPDTAQMVNSSLAASSFTLHTTTHECFHPVGCTQEVDKALGDDKPILEEGKASLGGILVTDSVNNGALSHRIDLAILCLTRPLRFFHKTALSNPTIAPYVRECKITVVTLYRAGVFTLEKDGVKINIDADRLSDWIREIEIFIKKLLHAYANKDTVLLHLLREEYCEDPIVTRMINWINREEIE
ncbi:MAG: hypothetical protein ABH837_00870 [bacterium]